MNIEEFRAYCLSKSCVTEETPFGPDTLVLKVAGKMFAAAGIELFERFNVKCDPEVALELREKFHAVEPGWHMNKTHWNTIYVNRDLGDKQLKHWINHSYELVVSKLPKSKREELKQ